MSPANQQFFSQPRLDLIPFTIPLSCFLQAGTVCTLILIIAQKATSEALVSLGEASEELFRGDRLPVLSFPEDHKLNQD
ncbi:MAG: hypothetical protein H9534_06175 [Dolichospermum circinale Clear-D4]|nr:hypothetical protein [Dolichospermum circinale Clear-D4]